MREIPPETILMTVTGPDGRHYYIRKNPSRAELEALPPNMRLLITEHDIYCWHTPILSHDDVSKQIGIDGVRVLLKGLIAANLEPIAEPSAFPWLFAPIDGNELDTEQRTQLVEAWLSKRLADLCPDRFDVVWYL